MAQSLEYREGAVMECWAVWRRRGAMRHDPSMEFQRRWGWSKWGQRELRKGGQICAEKAFNSMMISLQEKKVIKGFQLTGNILEKELSVVGCTSEKGKRLGGWGINEYILTIRLRGGNENLKI